MMRPQSRLAFVLVAAALAGVAGCDEDILNPMADRQPQAIRYLRASDFFSDGIGMRAPPAGTVPRERITG